MKYENYRGISLPSIPSKVFTKILDTKVKKVTENKVMEVQGGFRNGRSCVDQILIFTVRQLNEKMIEKDKVMVMTCVDLEKTMIK